MPSVRHRIPAQRRSSDNDARQVLPPAFGRRIARMELSAGMSSSSHEHLVRASAIRCQEQAADRLDTSLLPPADHPIPRARLDAPRPQAAAQSSKSNAAPPLPEVMSIDCPLTSHTTVGVDRRRSRQWLCTKRGIDSGLCIGRERDSSSHRVKLRYTTAQHDGYRVCYNESQRT